MSAERINVLQFRIGFLKQSKLNVAVRRLELIRVLALHGTIRSELLALLFVLYTAARGLQADSRSQSGTILPYDDGSFWALVIGLFFLVYRPVAVAAATRDARDATHRDDETPTIRPTTGANANRSVELL
jgi:hypothetical protein